MTFKRSVSVLLVCLCVGVAYGKAIKVTDLIPQGVENADADGMAILNYNAGQDRTEVQVALTGFTPNTVYTVDVAAVGGKQLSVETNTAGNGQSHGSAAADMTEGGTACVDVTVYLDANGNNFPDDGEVRATGTNCP